MYIDDSLKLFSEMANDGVQVNIRILNSLLLVHTNALRTREVEQRIMPMYARLGLELNLYTF